MRRATTPAISSCVSIRSISDAGTCNQHSYAGQSHPEMDRVVACRGWNTAAPTIKE